MQITLLITVSLTTGAAATPAELAEQLVEEVASIAQFAVEHSSGDGTSCCPALRMPMSGALWVPVVWGEETPPGVGAAGFPR